MRHMFNWHVELITIRGCVCVCLCFSLFSKRWIAKLLKQKLQCFARFVRTSSADNRRINAIDVSVYGRTIGANSAALIDPSNVSCRWFSVDWQRQQHLWDAFVSQSQQLRSNKNQEQSRRKIQTREKEKNFKPIDRLIECCFHVSCLVCCAQYTWRHPRKFAMRCEWQKKTWPMLA